MNTLNFDYINPFAHDARGKKWTQEKIKEVIDLFNLHKTVLRVASILDKSEDTIKKILNSNSISTPTRNQFSAQKWSFFEELQKPETQTKILKLYRNGVSTTQIAKQYGCSVSPIRKIIKKHKAQKNLPKHVLKLEKNKAEIIDVWKQGSVTFVELSKKYNCSVSAMRNFIQKNTKYKIRKKSKNPIPLEDIKKIYDLHHKQNWTMKQIGKLYGCTFPCVSDFFDKHKIPRRTKSESIRLKNYEETNIQNKSQNLAKRKMFTLPSGKTIKVLGYEDNFLNFVFKNEILKEEEIIYQAKSIPYKQNNVSRKYLPDFYIPKYNLIVEIKSKYTIKLSGLSNLLCKRKGVLDAGYDFCLVLDNNFDSFLNKLKTKTS